MNILNHGWTRIHTDEKFKTHLRASVNDSVSGKEAQAISATKKLEPSYVGSYGSNF